MLGPAPAPLTRLRGEHRAQFFLKGHSRAAMRAALRDALAALPDARAPRVGRRRSGERAVGLAACGRSSGLGSRSLRSRCRTAPRVGSGRAGRSLASQLRRSEVAGSSNRLRSERRARAQPCPPARSAGVRALRQRASPASRSEVLLSRHERFDRRRREAHDQHDQPDDRQHQARAIDAACVVERRRMVRADDAQHHAPSGSSRRSSCVETNVESDRDARPWRCVTSVERRPSTA